MGSCGHKTTASTYYADIGLALCSHCKVVVTKPYDDVIKVREAERDVLRKRAEEAERYLDLIGDAADGGVTGAMVEIKELEQHLAAAEQERDAARAELRSTAERRNEEILSAVETGLRAYAWWKDGIQYVGTAGRTLKSAIETMRKGGYPL